MNGCMILYIESSWKMDDVLLEERGHDSTPSDFGGMDDEAVLEYVDMRSGRGAGPRNNNGER